MDIKRFVRNTLIFFHLDLTKNLKYDRLTGQIMSQIIKPNSNCIDIGCHKGEILDEIIRLAPGGKHLAFEPIPHLYNLLKTNFSNKASVYPYALSEKNGISTFNFVKNAPAYSGIHQRRYDIKNPEIEILEVELKRLDEIVPLDLKIDLIKIDVEGGELNVLKGGLETIKKYKPYIIFECGLGASDFYGTSPEEIFDLLTDKAKLNIATLDGFLRNKNKLKRQEFISIYNLNKEYYFIAFPN